MLRRSIDGNSLFGSQVDQLSRLVMLLRSVCEGKGWLSGLLNEISGFLFRLCPNRVGGNFCGCLQIQWLAGGKNVAESTINFDEQSQALPLRDHASARRCGTSTDCLRDRVRVRSRASAGAPIADAGVAKGSRRCADGSYRSRTPMEFGIFAGQSNARYRASGTPAYRRREWKHI